MGSEVKGVWFVTAKSYMLDHGGAKALERVAEQLDPAFREAILDPLTSAWYPERALAQALAGMREVLGAIDDEVFCEVMRECSELGVNRFFRVLLRLSSASFVLRQTPTMWRQIRRGQGRVEVEPVQGGTLIHYRDFPWFEDVNYRLLAKGSLGAIVAIAAGKLPRVDIVDFGSDWLDARVEHK